MEPQPSTRPRTPSRAAAIRWRSSGDDLGVVDGVEELPSCWENGPCTPDVTSKYLESWLIKARAIIDLEVSRESGTFMEAALWRRRLCTGSLRGGTPISGHHNVAIPWQRLP